MRFTRVQTVAEMRELARARAPRMFFGYVDSGSWSEGTRDRNASDFERLLFRQRVCRDLSGRSLDSEMAGESVAMPLAIAPTGMAGMLWPDGEIALMRAAEAAGIPYVMSTMSICSIEQVAAAATRPFWFQLYLMRDRDFVRDLMRRAWDAGCRTLVLTLDLQVLGRRHADLRNHLSAPPKPSPPVIAQLLSRPGWCLRMLRAQSRTYANIVGHLPDVDGLKRMAEWTASQFDPSLDWDAVNWVREHWRGKLILKGILDPEDAHVAAGMEPDALIVSNHGGRQLDGAPSSIAALSAIAEAVGGRVELHLDGGVRSGQDILRALALGARGVYVGRPPLYGLAAAGQPGVAHVIGLLRDALDLSMAFCGHTRITDISPDILLNPGVLSGEAGRGRA
ncbi:MAG: alpha-hydroxy acid oxidase [Pikeienuella sp.]